MHRITFIALCTLLSAMSCYAQSTTPQPHPMQFRILSGNAAPEGLNYELDKQDVPIVVEQGMRSLPFAYGAANPLILYKLAPGADGKITRVPVISIDITNAGTFPLLVFFNDPASKSKLRVLTMREDIASFPAGTCRFANFSPLPAEISFGSSKFILGPSSIVDKRPSGTSALLTISALGRNGVMPILTHNMLIEPQKRSLILIVPVSGNPDMLTAVRLSDNAPK